MTDKTAAVSFRLEDGAAIHYDLTREIVTFERIHQ